MILFIEFKYDEEIQMVEKLNTSFVDSKKIYRCLKARDMRH